MKGLENPTLLVAFVDFEFRSRQTQVNNLSVN